MADKKRSLGGTLLLIAVVVLVWFARSKGWLPEERGGQSSGGDGGVATAPSEPGGPGASSKSPRSSGSSEGQAAPKSTGSKSTGSGTESEPDFEDGADEIVKADRYQRSGFMVTTKGVVKKSLRDDTDGHQHQRFILRLENGHTVLVAHNIDLAPRVPLDEGDTVTVHGQYEWNDQGGVLHWTHHDPQKRHEEGWIRHDGELYK